MARASRPSGDDKPHSLGDLAQSLFREQHKTGHLTLTRLRQHWPQVVGPELARKTHPARLEKATLLIHTLDAGWAHNLRFMAEDILGSVQAFLEADTVSKLRFAVGELPQAPAAPTPTQPNPAWQPDDQISQAAHAIADNDLRAHFIRTFSKMKAAHSKTPPPKT